MSKVKFKEILKRYLPIEIIGITTNLSATIGLSYYSDLNLLAISAIASTFEILGFYIFVISREIFTTYRVNKYYNFKLLFFDIKNLIIEFGPAELIDPTITRPALIFAGMSLLKNNPVLGGLLGKFAADLIFYTLSGIFYSWNQKRIKVN